MCTWNLFFGFLESHLVFTEIIYIRILKNFLKLDVEPLFIYLFPLSDAFVFLSFGGFLYNRHCRGFFYNSLHFAFVTFLAVIKYPDEIQVRGKEFILAYSSSGNLVQHGRKSIWHSSQEAE